ncbi:ABC transporter permease [Amycolatopsis sp. FDAARGOS 1241]|uniref:ABC transporter permease n=1 Tax=Amycolatopsis sp. FDAARGOS 1241 TaxID=2778070 RepID=UPI0019520C4B|nr:ABC transporter permease subunit [Amycolatopsis sp. FDAARGOS 1241]QRP43660.1 ABC transporter permease subunit [Amycolatopsis sp. FDAARGOS 1241]
MTTTTPRRQATGRRVPEKAMPVLLGGGFLVLVALLWQIAAWAGLVNPFLTSSPALIAAALGNQISSGLLLSSLGRSALELVIGFGIAAVAGVAVGLLMGRYRYVDYVVEPYVWLLYSAPIIAMFPLLVLVFGLGSPTVIAIAFLMSVVPVIVNSAQGVRNVDKKLIRTAVSFGAGEASLLRKVILPASVPTVMAGLRLGVGRGLVGVVVGEFFAGDGGIGYNISFFAGHLGTTDVLASVFVVIVVGVLLNVLARKLESLADSWRTELP